MPRQPKPVSEKIQELEQKIAKKKKEIAEAEQQLTALKEKAEQEGLAKISLAMKVGNLTASDVLALIEQKNQK